MSWREIAEGRYNERDRERWIAEPGKRVPAPERTAFERDRARLVHAASLRRLAAKTQVMGPQSDDFVRNRLTHSLEVAQVARDVAHPLGCHPDLTETAALAHDLGHPPFGHNGERALDDLTGNVGGFEGNAQTMRILTRLEAKSVDTVGISGEPGRSVGLNLTRATLDACTKYPWSRADAVLPESAHADGTPRTTYKFGVYDDDLPVFDWLRVGAPDSHRRCLEAQVMDFADDVAYSVHDLEDGVVAGAINLAALESAQERTGVWETIRRWYQPGGDDAAYEEAYAALRGHGRWPMSAYDGTRGQLAALKNLTSDLIGVFCGDVHAATAAVTGARPLVRYEADLIIPTTTETQILVLKGIAAHYVMQASSRVELMGRQRALLAELFGHLVAHPEDLTAQFVGDFNAAETDVSRTRVVADQVASLTDASAVALHAHLCR